jgi:hypothetical protein
VNPVNLAGSSGYVVRTEPTAVETLEHLEQTLDNLDPVDTRSDADKAADDAAERLRLKAEADAAFEATFTQPVEPLAAAIDAEADRIISEITGDASVDAVEPVNVPEGTDDDKAGE